MIKPWLLAPLVTVLALGASAVWWGAEKDRWTPPSARRPDLPTVAPMPAPAGAVTKQALAAPLFWASRRPNDVDDKKGGAAKELTQSRLTAVLESGKDRVAILQRVDGTILKITNQTKPWRVDSFDGRKAIFLSAGDLRVEKQLEALSPASAKPANPVLDRSRKPVVAQ